MLLGGGDDGARIAVNQLLEFGVGGLGDELLVVVVVMVVVLHHLLVVGGQHRGRVVGSGLGRARQNGGGGWRGERGDGQRG